MTETAVDAQALWAELLLASLVEAGVRDAVISPGSRSTPLVWAATEQPGLRCHALIDERSAGFFALGQARISGVPSVLICTSGSAPSHYYPAVIEARESGLPLIVLSADRPFEAQHSGAHQTIDQVQLFGRYARYHELGTPLADRASVLALRRVARRAVAESLTAPRGAFHINFRARKPLEPALDRRASEHVPLQPLPRLSPARALEPSAADVAAVVDALTAAECPLLICGAQGIGDSPSPELVRRYAAATGSVVCPETVSQLRFQLAPELDAGLVCDTYEWILGNGAMRTVVAPDFALQLGGVPVSTALSDWIERSSERLSYVICAEAGWPDPLHNAARIVRSSAAPLLEAVCAALESRPIPSRRSATRAAWRDAQGAARAAVDRHLRADFGEAAAVAQLVERLPRGSVLCVGNSLPPRLLDRYCAASPRGVKVCAQRGASGIEGAIAGALGAGTCAASAVTLLLGDVSFLHDVGSLWAASAARTLGPESLQPIVIVVLNNDGGRIFDGLPIARRGGVDLRWWTTPHGLGFEAAARLYGLPFARVSERAALAQALDDAYARQGPSLLEVVVDPASAARSARTVGAELDAVWSELASRLRPSAST